MDNQFLNERRRHNRFPVNITASCFDLTSERKVRAQTADISAHGLRLVTDHLLSPGSNLEIFLTIDDAGEKVHRKGRVMWSETIGSNKYSAGIQLEEKQINPVSLALRSIMTQRNY